MVRQKQELDRQGPVNRRKPTRNKHPPEPIAPCGEAFSFLAGQSQSRPAKRVLAKAQWETIAYHGSTLRRAARSARLRAQRLWTACSLAPAPAAAPPPVPRTPQTSGSPSQRPSCLRSSPGRLPVGPQSRGAPACSAQTPGAPCRAAGKRGPPPPARCRQAHA